ncbi:MAG: hypothetical protein AB7S77_02245, partial [Desulfatirhabdiaceae bacterium]
GNYFGTQTERDGGYSQPCWKPEPVTIDIFSATKNTNLKRKILNGMSLLSQFSGSFSVKIHRSPGFHTRVKR